MTFIKKSFRIVLICSFIFYLICLAYLLFFGYGREIVTDSYTLERYILFYKISTNFVPFKTIMLYMTDGGRHLNPGIAFTNIVGNIAAFAPLGVFIPLFFRRFRDWFPFILFAVAAPILVESIQFITLLGSSDIDDVILNAFGSILTFTVLKTTFISKIIFKLVE